MWKRKKKKKGNKATLDPEESSKNKLVHFGILGMDVIRIQFQWELRISIQSGEEYLGNMDFLHKHFCITCAVKHFFIIIHIKFANKMTYSLKCDKVSQKASAL